MQTTKVKMAVAIAIVMVVLSSCNPTVDKAVLEPTTVTVAIITPTPTPEPQPQVAEIAKVEEPHVIIEVKTEVKEEVKKSTSINEVAKALKSYRPKLSDKTAVDYAVYFVQACDEFKVDVYTAIGMGIAESSLRKDVVSDHGAIGIMQVMPATGRKYGVSRDQLFDPRINIKVGVHYLADLKYTSGCSWDTAIRGYNQGLQRAINVSSRGAPYLHSVQKHRNNIKQKVSN